MLHYRAARPADLDAIYHIYQHPGVLPYLSVDGMSRDDFAAYLATLLADGQFHAVEDGGELVGFYRTLRYDGRASHVAYLGTLAVDPARQGQGIARQMVEHAVSQLFAAGVQRVQLMVEADNPRAQALYRQLGFVHEGTQRAAYKRGDDYIDEWLMVRFAPGFVAANLEEAP